MQPHNATGSAVLRPDFDLIELDGKFFLRQVEFSGDYGKGRGFAGDTALLIPERVTQHELADALLFSAQAVDGQLVVETKWAGTPPMLYSYAPREGAHEVADGPLLCTQEQMHGVVRELAANPSWLPLVANHPLLHLRKAAYCEGRYAIIANTVTTLPIDTFDPTGGPVALAHVGYVLDGAATTATLRLIPIHTAADVVNRRWFGIEAGQRAVQVGSVEFAADPNTGVWRARTFQHMFASQEHVAKRAREREFMELLKTMGSGRIHTIETEK